VLRQGIRVTQGKEGVKKLSKYVIYGRVILEDSVRFEPWRFFMIITTLQNIMLMISLYVQFILYQKHAKKRDLSQCPLGPKDRVN
jgi:hypothetical protein